MNTIEQKAAEEVRITYNELQLLQSYELALNSFFVWQKESRTKADPAYKQTCANELKQAQRLLSYTRQQLTKHSIRPNKLKLAVARNAQLWRMCVVDLPKPDTMDTCAKCGTYHDGARKPHLCCHCEQDEPAPKFTHPKGGY